MGHKYMTDSPSTIGVGGAAYSGRKDTFSQANSVELGSTTYIESKKGYPFKRQTWVSAYYPPGMALGP